MLTPMVGFPSLIDEENQTTGSKTPDPWEVVSQLDRQMEDQHYEGARMRIRQEISDATGGG